jgi:hypothetical protein
MKIMITVRSIKKKMKKTKALKRQTGRDKENDSDDDNRVIKNSLISNESFLLFVIKISKMSKTSKIFHRTRERQCIFDLIQRFLPLYSYRYNLIED